MAQYISITGSAFGNGHDSSTTYSVTLPSGASGSVALFGGGAATAISKADLTGGVQLVIDDNSITSLGVLVNSGFACAGLTESGSWLLATATPTPTPSATPLPATATPEPATATPSPTPTETSAPDPATATPTPTVDPGTPTPTPTGDPTATPTPTPDPATATPTPSPTAEPTATPTATPAGFCQFVFVADSVDTTGYGLRYNLNGEVNTLFGSLLGTSTSYGGESGTVYSVCSSITPQYWEQSTNTTVSYPSGVEFIGAGDACASNNDCEYTGSPSTATPTPTPTAEPASVWYQMTNCATSAIAYSQEYYEGQFSINDRVTAPGGFTFVITGVGYADPGTTLYAITSTGLTDCPPVATATPTPTPTPTPLTAYTVFYDENSELTACAGTPDTTIYSNCNPVVQGGSCTLYTDAGGTTPVAGGYYYDGLSGDYFYTEGLNGIVQEVGSCPVPTATPTPEPALCFSTSGVIRSLIDAENTCDGPTNTVYHNGPAGLSNATIIYVDSECSTVQSNTVWFNDQGTFYYWNGSSLTEILAPDCP